MHGAWEVIFGFVEMLRPGDTTIGTPLAMATERIGAMARVLEKRILTGSKDYAWEICKE